MIPAQFDPIPACFVGVPFLDTAKIERIVIERLTKFERVTKSAAAFPIDIELLIETVEEIIFETYGPDKFPGEEVLGYYDFSEDKMFLLDCIGNKGRERFTLAHEYGHFVLHRPYFFQQVLDLFEEPQKVVQLHRAGLNKRDVLEIQANKFASQLLMPAHLVEQLLGAERFTASADMLIGRLALIAEVSYQAARIRLEQLGWISKEI